MDYPDITPYPLVDLINKEIYALDDYKHKSKLLRVRSRARRIMETLTYFFGLVWLLTAFMWEHELQMLTIAPLCIMLAIVSIDCQLYNLPKLKEEAERAKIAYEVSLQCTLGGTNANQH